MREPSCFWLPMLVRSFASSESSVIWPRDDRAAETSQAVVSEDEASTVSVRGFEKRVVKEKDTESLITRESCIISWDIFLDSNPECIIPSDVRICSDKL